MCLSAFAHFGAVLDYAPLSPLFTHCAIFPSGMPLPVAADPYSQIYLSGWFFWDLLAVIPFDLILLGVQINRPASLRLNRMIFGLHLSGYVEHFEMELRCVCTSRLREAGSWM